MSRTGAGRRRAVRLAAPLLLAAGLAGAGCGDRPRRAPPPAGIDPAAFDAALAPALDGDAAEALARLQALPAQALDDVQRRTVDCMRRRFGAAPDAVSAATAADAPGVDPATAAFRRHWTLRLRGAAPPAEADAQLDDALSRSATLSGAPAMPADANAAAAAHAQRLRTAGFGVLDGVTPPLREWLVWDTRHERRSVEAVALPDGAVTLALTRIREPLSRGWLDWASCGRHATRGWVGDDGSAFVVDGLHGDDDDAWRVELLAHEAQHVADLRRWPRMAAEDLEFRAKLVEIALSRDDRRAARLRAIASQARLDPASPHASASWHVVDALRRRLGDAAVGSLDGAALRDAALDALRAHARAMDGGGVGRAEPHSGRRVVGVLTP